MVVVALVTALTVTTGETNDERRNNDNGGSGFTLGLDVSGGVAGRTALAFRAGLDPVGLRAEAAEVGDAGSAVPPPAGPTLPEPDAYYEPADGTGHGVEAQGGAGSAGTTDAPAVASEPGTASREALAQMVYDTFPDDPRMAEHVVWAESMGDWAGEGWVCHVYGPCLSPTSDCGLMQIHWPIHGAKFGWNLAACFDPVQNLAVARQIYDSQGPSAWASY